MSFIKSIGKRFKEPSSLAGLAVLAQVVAPIVHVSPAVTDQAATVITTAASTQSWPVALVASLLAVLSILVPEAKKAVDEKVK